MTPASRPAASLWRSLMPPRLFVGSFAVLVGPGTLGLRFLPGLYVGDQLGRLDSLFTAASAVCVTGLIVVDTATLLERGRRVFTRRRRRRAPAGGESPPPGPPGSSASVGPEWARLRPSDTQRRPATEMTGRLVPRTGFEPVLPP